MSDTNLMFYASLVQLLSQLQSVTTYLDALSPLTQNQELLRDQVAYLLDSVTTEIYEMECEQLQELTDDTIQ